MIRPWAGGFDWNAIRRASGNRSLVAACTAEIGLDLPGWLPYQGTVAKEWFVTQLVIRFDMRNPQPGTPKAALYDAAMEMAAWADRAGFDIVEVSEHHGSEDRYLPSHEQSPVFDQYTMSR